MLENLNLLLSENKSAIIKKWFEKTIDNYSSDTSVLYKKKDEQFNNPVGYNLYQGLEKLFEYFLGEKEADEIAPFLHDMMRILAVQNFTPSQALAFVFQIKTVIKSEYLDKKTDYELLKELLSFEAHIDELALMAFDLYMQCREKVYELKANDARDRTFRLLQKAEMVCETQDDENGSKEQ